MTLDDISTTDLIVKYTDSRNYKIEAPENSAAKPVKLTEMSRYSLDTEKAYVWSDKLKNRAVEAIINRIVNSINSEAVKAFSHGETSSTRNQLRSEDADSDIIENDILQLTSDEIQLINEKRGKRMGGKPSLLKEQTGSYYEKSTDEKELQKQKESIITPQE